MNFMEAVKTCFRKYFGFSGRARRSEYWWFFLFNFLVALVLGVIDAIIFGVEGPVSATGASAGFESGNGPLGSIYNLIVLFPSLAVGWRRLHDTGRSGWWLGGFYLVLIAFAFYAGFSIATGGSINGPIIIGGVLVLLAWAITILVFLCLDSHKDDNRYGPSPKYGGQAHVFE